MSTARPFTGGESGALGDGGFQGRDGEEVLCVLVAASLAACILVLAVARWSMTSDLVGTLRKTIRPVRRRSLAQRPSVIT
jgi:hypothetical protein